MGVHLEGVFLQKIPLKRQILTFPGFTEVADRKLLDAVFAVKVAGQKIVDPVHVAGIVHMAVSVQIRKADPPLPSGIQGHSDKTVGAGQLVAPEGTDYGDSTFPGEDHIPGVQVHQNPQADGTEALTALHVIGHHASGIGHPGGGHGPGLNANGFSPGRQTGDLNPVPGYGPEKTLPGQGVIVQRQLVAVQSCNLLGEKKNLGWHQSAVAVYIQIADGKILIKEGFHKKDLESV